MAMNPYESCPCGSGKKAKWCCLPIEDTVNKAIEQFQEGQRETALRTMDDLIREHGDNPQAYGHKAQMLMALGRIEEADQTLDIAFKLNPTYPFGLMLRGMFRQQEGEIKGALTMFRRAVDAYDPEAKGPLGQLYDLIGNAEVMFNRPIAARYAMQKAVDLYPTDEELRTQFSGLFDDPARFPHCARKEYLFRPMKSGVTLNAKAPLAELLTALTGADAQDAGAAYNLAMVCAWQGDNAKSLEALNRSLELETDDAMAEESEALAEVLRFGAGLDEMTDHIEHRVFYRIRDSQLVMKSLQELAQERRLIGARQNPRDGSISGLILEGGSLAIGFGDSIAKLGAYLFVMGDVVRLWHADKSSVEKIAKELVTKTSLGMTEVNWESGSMQFSDVVIEAIRFPTGQSVDGDMEVKLRQEIQRFYEEIWVNRPLKALNGLTPATATNSPASKKKLGGLIRFLHDCFELAMPVPEGEDGTPPPLPYNFDGLRAKLGLATSTGTPAAIGPVTIKPTLDIGTMSAEQLAGLTLEELSPTQLEEGFRTAMRLSDRTQGDRFATAVTSAPANPQTPDRYAFFSHLILSAQNAGQTDRMMELLDAGALADREQNEGKRQGDYLLRHGQLLIKQGNADEAVRLYHELADNEASELKHVVSAVESLLSAKRPKDAVQLAEKGLLLVRQKGNRDIEGYFHELLDAAKKQGG